MIIMMMPQKCYYTREALSLSIPKIRNEENTFFPFSIVLCGVVDCLWRRWWLWRRGMEVALLVGMPHTILLYFWVRCYVDVI